MGALIGQPDFPIDFLRPTRISFDTVGNEVDGGVNGVGESTSIETSGGGMWTAMIEGMVLEGPDERYEVLSMLGARLNGGFRNIVVPLVNDRVGPFPIIRGRPRPLVTIGRVPFAIGGEAASGSFLTKSYDVEGKPVDSQAFVFSRNSVATYVDSAGIVRTAAAGEPRFDYDPATGAARGLLVEPARTNLILRSEAIATAPWGTTYGVVPNVAAAPDGTMTAAKLVRPTGQALTAGGVTQNVAKDSVARKVSFSFYAAAAGFNRAQIFLNGANTTSARAVAVVNLLNGSVVSIARGTSGFDDATVLVERSALGFWRITLTVTTDTHTVITARMYSLDSTATVGDGTSGILVWGAQLELGDGSTSYIPTATAAATRESDQLSISAPEANDWSIVTDNGSATFNNVKRQLALDSSLLPSTRIRSYSAIRKANGSDLITHSDGAPFSDGAGYSQASVYGEVVAMESTGILRVRVYGGARKVFRWSDFFSIYHPTKGWRLYRSWELLDQTDEANPVSRIAIQPPLREAVSPGDRIELARPRCVMKQARGQTIPWGYEGWYSSRPSVSFSEAF